jgi:hypothetical protein
VSFFCWYVIAGLVAAFYFMLRHPPNPSASAFEAAIVITILVFLLVGSAWLCGVIYRAVSPPPAPASAFQCFQKFDSSIYCRSPDGHIFRPRLEEFVLTPRQ